MSMPLVSREIIDSIRFQSNRSTQEQSLYCVEVMKEITEENPYLARAMQDTMKVICKECDLNPEIQRDFTIMINMINLSTSVYQALKQQMICDELESWK